MNEDDHIRFVAKCPKCNERRLHDPTRAKLRGILATKRFLFYCQDCKHYWDATQPDLAGLHRLLGAPAS
jgi:uncharacterized protein with PIN domain